MSREDMVSENMPSTYRVCYCEVHDQGWLVHKDAVPKCPWCQIFHLQLEVESIRRTLNDEN